jgi:iron complex outermembrane receptor protein
MDHPIYQVIVQQSTDRGVFARLDYAAGAIEATLGGESRWGDTRSRRFINVEGQRGAPIFVAHQDARTSTLYGEVRVRPVPSLSFIAGGIYADAMRRQDQRVPVPQSGTASFSSFSPRFGLLWEPSDHIQLFANYSRSADFPTFVELAQTAEVGTRGRKGWASWDLSLYRATLNGEMLQYSVGPDIPASTFNAGRTLHQGVEAAITIDPLPWLRLRQIWQYSDFRFRRDNQFGNNRLPVIPRHVLRTEMRLGNDALHVAANVEVVPDGARADYRNSLRTPGYALVGLTAGVVVRDGIDLFVDIRNLTGKKAVGDISATLAATAASAIFYPVERRAFYAGFRARF